MVNYDVTTNNAELSYDFCEKCGSLWMDAGALDKMAFQVAGSIELCSDEKDKKRAKGIKKCPQCDDLPLSRVKFLGETDIASDHCKNCGGFWLDAGELKDYLSRDPARGAEPRRQVRLEKSAGKLPANAPIDAETIPTINAMMTSNGQRLCEVGSPEVSTATRTMTAAGTAAPTTTIAVRKWLFPKPRAAAAAILTTIRPTP
jgi:Zn-finger nucleic acid-binding protein